MPTDRELMQQALYYMDDGCGKYSDDYRKLIEALRARLAHPEHEPIVIDPDGTIRLLKNPPQREWHGLTDEEIVEIAATPAAIPGAYVHCFARAIEAKLKEKNAL